MKKSKMNPEIKSYIAKTLGFVGNSDPLALLHSGPVKIERAVRGLTNSQLKKRPGPGKWSIHEIIGHLADTESVFAWRLRRAMAEPGSRVEGYDQNVWAKTFNYSKTPFNELLNGYKQSRTWNLIMLDSLPSKTRAKGWISHSERGKEKGEHLLSMCAGHDLNHLSQIEAIKTRFKWANTPKKHSVRSGAQFSKIGSRRSHLAQ
jgi:uncharacterized damage-inducible protein DinB